MKILLLNDDYSAEDGNSVAGIVRNLAASFRERGHDAHVLTTHRSSKSAQIIRQEGVTSLPSDYRMSLRHYLSLWRPSMSRMVRAEIGRIRPDIVHAHNLHIHLTFDALRIARTYTDRVFLTLHDAMSFAEGRIATQRLLDSGGTDARLSVFDRIRMVGLQYNPLRNTIIRRSINAHAKAVTAVSGALAKAAGQHGIRNVKVVHNVIDARDWETSEEDRTDFLARHQLNNKKLILFAGRLREEKGIVALTRAFELVRKSTPEARLLIVGEEDRWRGLATQAGVSMETLNDCLCLGWLSQNELRKAYAACDTVAVPSVYLDPFVLVNLEAMASGKPVVGTCFGGTPEIVEDGITGIIVDPRNTNTLAAALEKLLKDPALATRMGVAGKKRALEHFAPAQQIESYMALYDSVA